jgi:hypothetical protein
MRVILNLYFSESDHVKVYLFDIIRFYSNSALFLGREEKIKAADGANQLSPGERRGLVRYLDDNYLGFAE